MVLRHASRQPLDGEPDLQVVAEADNGKEAVEAVLQHPPDVVMMDLSVPELDSVEASDATHYTTVSGAPTLRKLVAERTAERDSARTPAVRLRVDGTAAVTCPGRLLFCVRSTDLVRNLSVDGVGDTEAHRSRTERQR